MSTVTVQAQFSRHGWLVIPVNVGDLFVLEMATSGLPHSHVAPDVIGALPMYFQRVDVNRYMLSGAKLGQQPIADLEVGVSSLARRLGVHGILGTNFLSRFTDINLHVPSLRLTLVSPE